MFDTWIVVKVGGSLYDLPDLRERLGAFLAGLNTSRVLIVPGGGMTADVIRTLDRVHRLGEEAAHWLALRTLSVNAHFLRELLPAAQLISDASELAAAPSGWYVLEAYSFFRADEQGGQPLPHDWRVTSDSLAVRAAVLAGAQRLILLKSREGGEVVDEYFAEALRRGEDGMQVGVVNMRG